MYKYMILNIKNDGSISESLSLIRESSQIAT